MDEDQRNRLNSYNVTCDVAGGKRIKTLKELLDFMVVDKKHHTTPPSKASRQSSGSLCHLSESSDLSIDPNALIHESRKRGRTTKTNIFQSKEGGGRQSIKRTKAEMERGDEEMQQGVASINTQTTMDNSIAWEIENANKRARDAEDSLRQHERTTELKRSQDEV